MILDGKQIHWLEAFKHSFAVFSIKKGCKKLYGVVHSDGRIRIEPKYEIAHIFNVGDGWICHFGNWKSPWKTARLDDWNDMGKPIKYDGSFGGEGVYYLTQRKGGYKGVHKKNPANVILQPVYRRIFWTEDAFVAKNSKNLWGVVNIRGKIIIPFEYDYISGYDTYFIVRKNMGDKCKCGLMDRKGRLKIPFIYENIYPINSKYVTAVDFNDNGEPISWKFMDIKGNEIQPTGKPLECYGYNNIDILSCNPDDNILDVCVFSNYGGVIEIDEIEKTYHFIIPISNNHIQSCSDGNFKIHRKDTMKYGLVSSKGKGLVPCEYDDMEYGDNPDLITVRKGDEWFCINSRNERVLF